MAISFGSTKCHRRRGQRAVEHTQFYLHAEQEFQELGVSQDDDTIGYFYVAHMGPTRERKERLPAALQHDDYLHGEPERLAVRQLKGLHAQERASQPPKNSSKRRGVHAALVALQHAEPSSCEELWREEPGEDDCYGYDDVNEADHGELDVGDVQTVVEAEFAMFNNEMQEASYYGADGDASAGR